MTYHITRHAKIKIPKVLQPMFSADETTPEEESKGPKRLFQKTAGLLPIPACGVITGFTVFQPSLAAIGLGAGTVGYSATLIGSCLVLLTTTVPIFKDIVTGRRKYLPGKSQLVPDRKMVKEIEPYAEWDNVFLPYAAESFNGVKVKNSEGNYRKPISVYTARYVEFRTAPRTTGIDDSIMEAQQF